MTITDLEKKLYEITALYFGGAVVVFAGEKLVKPLLPLVTIKTGDVSRSLHPIRSSVQGEPYSQYPARTVFEVNLFTKGEPIKDGNGVLRYENTAVNDMLDFTNYLESPYVTNLCEINNVGLLQKGEVRDLSDVVNDAFWSYRAMVEYDVDFMQLAVGFTGILDESSVKGSTFDPKWSQTHSGGGTEDLAGYRSGYFEKVADIEMEEDDQ